MEYNTANNNSGGILEFIIPGDPKERSSGNTIRYNVVMANNNKNKCTGGVVCTVPPGTGILIIGGTNNQTTSNYVTNNRTYGIALTDVCTAFSLFAAQELGKKLPYNPIAGKEQDQQEYRALQRFGSWIGDSPVGQRQLLVEQPVADAGLLTRYRPADRLQLRG